MDNLQKNKINAVIALGMFDGVHIGHRNLLQKAKKVALKFGATPIAYTFSNHPREVLGLEQKLLTLANEKENLINKLGVKTKLIKFTKQIANLKPLEFLDLINQEYNIKAFVVGFNYYFGYKATGDIDMLKKYCLQNNIELHVIEPVKFFHQVVSSTVIRDNLLAGDIIYANKLLKTPYFMCGEVVTRKKIGRTLGFPTANIDPKNKFIPKFGIYATILNFFDSKTKKYKSFKSVTNIGIRPTIVEFTKNKDNTENQIIEPVVTIEAHILDFNQEIYAKNITISFLEYLRPELKFDNFELLSAQIQKDCDDTQEYFAKKDFNKLAMTCYKIK